MEKGLVPKEYLQNIANAIRNKNGETVTYKPSEMAQAIRDLPNGSNDDVKGLIERSLTSIIIPDGVTSIGNYAFSNCANLANITIPESVTSIGSYAFSNCANLANISIPESVTSIGSNTFFSCTNLASITIPESVTSIGTYIFRNCANLTSVTIPNSVTSIGNYLFYNCYRLTNITLGNGFNLSGLDLSASTQYTAETIVSCLEALADRTGQTAYRIVWGNSNLAKLTDEQKAIAINKNWTLA